MGKTSTNVLAGNVLSINAAKAVGGKRTEFRVSDRPPGLVLTCYPTGSASWFFYYSKMLGGKQVKRKVKLGERSSLSLAEATDKALELRKAVNEGGDPALEIKVRSEAITFEAMAEEFLASGKLSEKSSANYGNALRKHAYPIIGKMPAGEVTGDHIVAICKRIEQGGAVLQADKVKAYIGGTYRYGMGQRYVGFNPTAGVARRAEKSVRDRAPSDEEVAALWLGPDQPRIHMTEAMRDCIRLCILTGQRRGEVAGARVEEFEDLDGDEPKWTIPGHRVVRGRLIRGRVKNGREQVVRLSKQAAALAKSAIVKHATEDGYLFPPRAKAKQPHVDPHSVSKAFARLVEFCDLEDLVLHDMRSALGNWCKNAGIGREVRDILLNHKDDSVDGVHYSAGARMEVQAREAWQAWADHVSEITGDGDVVASNVTRLRA